MSRESANETFVREAQYRLGVPVDGWAGKNTLDAFNATVPAQTIQAKDTSLIPADYWPMLSKIESADRPYVKASTSSGSGLYQFLRATWLGEGGQWGGDSSKAFGGLKPSVEEQLQRAKTFTQKNVTVLKAKGVPINKATLYAAHFFGAGMAAKVLAASLNDRADLIAGPGPTNANPSILKNKTVGDVVAWLKKKTGDVAR